MGDPAEKHPDDAMLVQLTAGQLKALMRDAVQEALKGAPATSAPYLDVVETADHFGVDRRTILNWIAKGAPAYQAGRDYRIKLPEFEQWVKEQRSKKIRAVK